MTSRSDTSARLWGGRSVPISTAPGPLPQAHRAEPAAPNPSGLGGVPGCPAPSSSDLCSRAITSARWRARLWSACPALSGAIAHQGTGAGWVIPRDEGSRASACAPAVRVGTHSGWWSDHRWGNHGGISTTATMATVLTIATMATTTSMNHTQLPHSPISSPRPGTCQAGTGGAGRLQASGRRGRELCPGTPLLPPGSWQHLAGKNNRG